MTEINILATTDVHGFIEENAGSSALAISKIKDQYSNALLIDNGDFFIGNPLTSYFSFQKNVSPLVDFANDCHYDIMAPGNHDFDHGLSYLEQQVQNLKADYLCCNVFKSTDQLVFKPWIIKEVADVKIGVIGVLTSGMSMISDYKIMNGLVVKDALTELQCNVKELRSKVDLLIVAYHGGIERDLATGRSTTYATGEDETYKLVSKISGIDGFICGHQHWINQGKVNNTAVIQCGYAGNCYGHLKFNMESGKPTEVTSKIVELAKLPSEQKTYYDSKSYQDWLKHPVDISKLQVFLKQKFGRCNLGIFLKLKGNSNQELIDSFPVPYSVRIYHLNASEYSNFIQQEWTIKEENHQADATDFLVLTNSYEVPEYRLEEEFVHNIFDQYLFYLQQRLGD
ncbi:bifunctional metallophosphatase/5'-nucleotidase [Xylocopilactobacillus apicola]|uniref:Calcineurin-like phosphoesterase domain-containing protein n=1 Tax=Xylocopilactobacillus apicola TaxID=2932184 RepID=A0AAU9DCQ8_9LACO|nr:metallophosphoesterase [Xylocopilactobacillus apicola]BDR58592.1 hypothetical protein XA3_10330 [Xylocopilactobacillus apicola]